MYGHTFFLACKSLDHISSHKWTGLQAGHGRWALSKFVCGYIYMSERYRYHPRGSLIQRTISRLLDLLYFSNDDNLRIHYAVQFCSGIKQMVECSSSSIGTQALVISCYVFKCNFWILWTDHTISLVHTVINMHFAEDTSCLRLTTMKQYLNIKNLTPPSISLMARIFTPLLFFPTLQPWNTVFPHTKLEYYTCKLTN